MPPAQGGVQVSTRGSGTICLAKGVAVHDSAGETEEQIVYAYLEGGADAVVSTQSTAALQALGPVAL